MIKQMLMLVLVLISSAVFALDTVTQGNRVEQKFNRYEHDYTWTTAIDKDPPDTPEDEDPIVRARSRTSARNADDGVHKWTAISDVECFSEDYDGTWALDSYTPHEVPDKGIPGGAGRFEGTFRRNTRAYGEVLGAFDCRISIGHCRTSGSITAYKLKDEGDGASGSEDVDEDEGPAAWATSFFPWHLDGNPGGNPNPPQRGISPADPNQIPQPGDSATLNLITSEPYYWVDWYVKAPWESGDRGTHQEGTLGDGTSTSTSLSYTFPSGIMHTGDFLITAVIYRWSDMSTYEETYTVTVDMTPNCDDCTDGNSNCPNASAH